MENVSFLVVDGSSIVRTLIKKVIETKIGQNKVYEAPDGKEALNILKANHIDIIISDWNMPKMSGDKLLQEVRRRKEWEDIAFIMMSLEGGKDFIAAAVQLGVDHYLIKPFTPEYLEETIRKSWIFSKQRRAQRFACIPKYNLTIKTDGWSFIGEVVNISRSGILIRLDYAENFTLFKRYELALEVTGTTPKHAWVIDPLIGKAVRLEASGVPQSSEKCLMALYFEPGAMNKQVEENLLSFLEWLSSNIPEFIPAE